MINETTPNKRYRDTLFRAIFGRQEHKHWLLELYNALNNTSYTNVDDLELTTLEDVIYVNVKNDVSCLIGDTMSLFEHQSTINPNMPLRGLFYFAELYRKKYHDAWIFKQRHIKISTPQYYVFYNGREKVPENSTLLLSDAFIHPAPPDQPFEWSCRVININKGNNSDLVERCKPLKDYCTYVRMIQDGMRNGKTLDQSTDRALDYAVRNNLLDGFFKAEQAEVKFMGMTEYDEEAAHKAYFEDGVYFTEQRLQPMIDSLKSQNQQQASQLTQQASQLSQKDAELQKLQAYILEHGLKLPSDDLRR